MNKTLMAAATALSMVAVPAMAQDDNDAPGTMYPLAAVDNNNREEIETYDEDRQRIYYGWPLEVRSYYWTLDGMERDAFWTLDTDTDRVAQYTMYSRNSTNFVRSGMVQDVPMPRTAHNGDYPICESDADDHCINAYAAGMRGADVNRPLGYWPGETASNDDFGG